MLNDPARSQPGGVHHGCHRSSPLPGGVSPSLVRTSGEYVAKTWSNHEEMIDAGIPDGTIRQLRDAWVGTGHGLISASWDTRIPVTLGGNRDGSSP